MDFCLAIFRQNNVQLLRLEIHLRLNHHTYVDILYFFYPTYAKKPKMASVVLLKEKSICIKSLSLMQPY